MILLFRSWDYNGPGRTDFKFQTVTAVDEDGSWSIVKPILETNKGGALLSFAHCPFSMIFLWKNSTDK